MPYISLFLAALIAAAPFFLALALIVDGAADVIKNGKPCWAVWPGRRPACPADCWRCCWPPPLTRRSGPAAFHPPRPALAKWPEQAAGRFFRLFRPVLLRFFPFQAFSCLFHSSSPVANRAARCYNDLQVHVTGGAGMELALKLLHSPEALDEAAFLAVFRQSSRENAPEWYPDLSPSRRWSGMKPPIWSICGAPSGPKGGILALLADESGYRSSLRLYPMEGKKPLLCRGPGDPARQPPPGVRGGGAAPGPPRPWRRSWGRWS